MENGGESKYDNARSGPERCDVALWMGAKAKGHSAAFTMQGLALDTKNRSRRPCLYVRTLDFLHWWR